MIKSIRAHPFVTALLTFVAYVLFFTVVPEIINTFLPWLANSGGSNSSPLQGLLGLNQVPWQIGIAVVLSLVVALLGWRREVGFHKSYPGSLKYLLIPVVLFGLLFGAEIVGSISSGGRDIFMLASLTTALAFVLANLLIGFTEELMFRGILFQGLRTHLTPVWTVIVSSLLFGSLHFANLLSGAPLAYTLLQVGFAAGLGFMLGALRLRGGAILPLMLFHAAWDFINTDIDILGTTQGQTAISDPNSQGLRM